MLLLLNSDCGVLKKTLKLNRSGLPDWHFNDKFQKFGPYYGGLAWENPVRDVRLLIVLHVFAFFNGVGRKRFFGIFVKPVYFEPKL